MDVTEKLLREQYSQFPEEELLQLYQRDTLTEKAKPILENELRKRGFTLDQAKRMTTPSLNEIDKAVAKERTFAALIHLFWKIFYKIIVPIILISLILYGWQLWNWVTH